MSNFKAGDKVLVTGSNYYKSDAGANRGVCLVGKVCEIKSFNDYKQAYVYTPDKSDYWIVLESDLQDAVSPPNVLTINGVEYIRKPEPVVDHEWKFGDWARHPEYGVVFVRSGVDSVGDVWICYEDRSDDYCNVGCLTFISRAEIPA